MVRNRLLEKLLKQRVKIVFCHLRSCLGESDSPPKTVWIDLRKNTNPARVFMHELFHLYYPEMSEKEVRAREWRLWKRTTAYERWLIGRRLFKSNWRE